MGQKDFGSSVIDSVLDDTELLKFPKAFFGGINVRGRIVGVFEILTEEVPVQFLKIGVFVAIPFLTWQGAIIRR